MSDRQRKVEYSNTGADRTTGFPVHIDIGDPDRPNLRLATAGGIVAYGSRYFVLTVQHAFDAAFDTTRPPPTPVEIFATDDAESEGSAWTGELSWLEQATSAPSSPSRSIHSENSNNRTDLSSTSSDDSAESDLLSNDIPQSPEHEKQLTSDALEQLRQQQEADAPPDSETTLAEPTTLETFGKMVFSSENDTNRHLDYALIKIDEGSSFFELAQSNLPREPSSSLVANHFRFPLKAAPEVLPLEKDVINVHVMCASQTRRPIVGRITGSTTTRIINESNDAQELWPLDVDEPLKLSDSGSWVIDAEPNELYGHVIDIRNDGYSAYIVRMFDIQNDISRNLQEILAAC